MTRFFGVVTGRDYFKLNGKRVPFWDILGRSPKGWLTSLAKVNKQIPQDSVRIFDCGSYTYRKKHTPQLKGEEVTAEWAYNRYYEHATIGDFVIAPDHMLMDGVDVDFRRKYNVGTARKFLQLDHVATPMAVAHGMNKEEFVSNFATLKEMGYDHVALGGLAARARRVNWCKEVVGSVRKSFPSVYLHVLGLSAPSYAEEWYKIGVDSFDGASYFYKATTAGVFFMVKGGKLIKHKAVKKGQEVVAPKCACSPCSTLRSYGYDTRSYGTSAQNIGRAAHNLEAMLRVYEENISSVLRQ